MTATTFEIKNLFAILKRELKARSITYKYLSESLNISESSIKRWFSQERMTLEQLGLIVNCLGLNFSELLQNLDEPSLEQMSPQQEAKLVSDPVLTIIYMCISDNWTIKEITSTYKITEIECLKALLALDRMRLIDLLPLNRIRMRFSRSLNWLPDGPLQKFFFGEQVKDFLDSDFDGERESRLYMRAHLTPAAHLEFQTELQQLKNRMAELHQESLKAPAEQRRTVTAVVAQREWEQPTIAALRRVPQSRRMRAAYDDIALTEVGE